MPFTRVSVDRTRTTAEIKAIGEAIYQSFVEAVNVPVDDKFLAFTRHTEDEFIYSRDYLGIQRSEHFILIQIFFYVGRTVDQKRLLFKTIADKLYLNPGIRKEDIFITLIDVPKENWSYGNGEAQFAGA
jgi:4-oxalocrotonate tautomerase